MAAAIALAYDRPQESRRDGERQTQPRAALITGAGAASAAPSRLTLAHAGYAVVLHAHRSRAEAETLAGEIGREAGGPRWCWPISRTPRRCAT